jgi:hypothetical protein
MRKLVLVLTVSVVTAGCGGSKHGDAAPPVRPQEWRAVVTDWANNDQVTGRHSCGAVVEAVAHIGLLRVVPKHAPGLPYRPAIVAFDSYATRVCPARPQLSKIGVGMSDAEVAEVAGMPRTPGLHCWLYPVTLAHDGRRVCFAYGRVTLVQRSVHL